jgi:serine/threonine-protein kinase 24/25/MST4
VKKIDVAATQRMSNEYIGSGSVRRLSAIPQQASTSTAAESGASNKPVALDSPIRPREPLSARGRAGQVLVEEVMLGVLDSVSGARSVRPRDVS